MSLNPHFTETDPTVITDGIPMYLFKVLAPLGILTVAEILVIVSQLEKLSAQIGLPVHEVVSLLSKEQVIEIALFLPGVIINMFETYPPLLLIPTFILAAFLVSLDVKNWNSMSESAASLQNSNQNPSQDERYQ